MNNFTERHLATRYRSLLSVRGHLSIFGFECHDGWSDLLEGTFRLIQGYAEQTSLEVRVIQVKEKFGELRIYQRGGDDTIALALDITEQVSSCVCELCGERGETTERQGWLQTRCLKHRGVVALDGGEPTCPDERYILNYAAALSLILYFFNDSAARWVQQKSIALGGIRPFEAMASSEGCKSVYTLLMRLEYGVGV